MTEIKHTSGPWTISKIGNNYDQYMIYSETENIANTVEGKANAQLIAAAPELHKFAETVIQKITEFNRICEADEYTDPQNTQDLLTDLKLHAEYVLSDVK